MAIFEDSIRGTGGLGRRSSPLIIDLPGESETERLQAAPPGTFFVGSFPLSSGSGRGYGQWACER